MITLEHAFNAKDMDSLIRKIMREQVKYQPSFSSFVLRFDLDSTIVESVQYTTKRYFDIDVEKRTQGSSNS